MVPHAKTLTASIYSPLLESEQLGKRVQAGRVLFMIICGAGSMLIYQREAEVPYLSDRLAKRHTNFAKLRTSSAVCQGLQCLT